MRRALDPSNDPEPGRPPVRTVKLTRIQQGLAALAFLLLSATLATGPVFAAYNSAAAQRQLQQVHNTETGIQHLLDFVAAVQQGNDPGSIDSRWYVSQLQGICRAVPPCRPQPAPTDPKRPSPPNTSG